MQRTVTNCTTSAAGLTSRTVSYHWGTRASCRQAQTSSYKKGRRPPPSQVAIAAVESGKEEEMPRMVKDIIWMRGGKRKLLSRRGEILSGRGMSANQAISDMSRKSKLFARAAAPLSSSAGSSSSSSLSPSPSMDNGAAKPDTESLAGEVSEIRSMLNEHQDILMQIQLQLQKLGSQKGSHDGQTTRASPKQLASEKTNQSETSENMDVPKKKSPRGFVDFHRNPEPYRPALERLRDWGEIYGQGHADPGEQKRQAARCMDCGTPFCQTYTGCPLGNLIPEWNELVLTDQWEAAIDRLHATNNFPEFTGRACPAPCEGACVAGLVDQPVTIKNMEWSIIERAWKEGWVKPRVIPESDRTGKKVAVVGSGPAGLAAADQLNKMGHRVTVYEREDRIGGLLMYGIPQMKLDKMLVERRVNLLAEEGIEFVTNSHIDTKEKADELASSYDAILLSIGATKPRDLNVPGRNLNGIVFAMDFLTKNMKDLQFSSDGKITSKWGDIISAQGKDVVVIGGGDTGTDCIGTSVRQYCKSLVNLELQSKPPPTRDPTANAWPKFPRTYKLDYGHEEVKVLFGKDPREFAVLTKSFVGDGNGNVKGIRIVNIEQDADGKLVEIEGTESELPADLIILAMGFLGPEESVTSCFGLELNKRGNIKPVNNVPHTTSRENVFACGDCRVGQSLIVTAIREGRTGADQVDSFLSSTSLHDSVSEEVTAIN